MEKIIEILNQINPAIDYENVTDLVDGGHLDSMSILELVTELESEFDVDISPIDLVPANFNSVSALWSLMSRLRDEA
ncbi:MAG: acyl carrier protein [Erysipelothrix sp.]